MIEAWHFVGPTLRDGRPVPADGVHLIHDGPIVWCKSGLYASRWAIDALSYAPESATDICRVLCEDIDRDGIDKLSCRRRTILWRVPAAVVLPLFARWCAMQAAHLWAMPAVVREYLETGREDIRDAAADAAWIAMQTAEHAGWVTAWCAWTAARTASRNSVGVAQDSARAAKCAAAWTAARDAGVDVDTAWTAARTASRNSVGFEQGSARAAECAAAWTAARDAGANAQIIQNARLEEMLFAAQKVALA